MQWRPVAPQHLLRRIRLVLCLVVACFAPRSESSAQDAAAILEDSLIKIVANSEASVVSISRFKPSPEDRKKDDDWHRPFGRERMPTEMEMVPNDFGAGILINLQKSSERLILTNYHLVRGGPVYPALKAEDGTVLTIHFSDRRGSRGTIIAADPRSDLAVIRVPWAKSGIEQTDFPVLNWETAAPVRKGQFVILLGNPYAIARDGSASVSWGLVSNLTRAPLTLERSRDVDREERAERSMFNRLGSLMQLDARLNLGTSGGPVLNLKGELIGISTSLAAIEGYEQSGGFALPIDFHTRRIVRTLLNGQEVEYGMIGITPETVTAEEEFTRHSTRLPQRSAARVTRVSHRSPAAHAGILPDDIIIRVDSEPVLSDSDLMRLIGMNAPESIVTLTLWRPEGHRSEIVKVKLCKWAALDDEGIIETNPRYAPWRGLSVDFSTGRHRYFEPTNFDSRRVLVTKVADNSPCHAAHLQPGNFITHVNHIAVQTPSEFYTAVNEMSGTVALTLSEPYSIRGEASRVVHVRE